MPRKDCILKGPDLLGVAIPMSKSAQFFGSAGDSSFAPTIADKLGAGRAALRDIENGR